MEYRSKYKAEEIEAILDAKNNTGEGVDSNLDEMFSGQLQTKEVEVSADTTIKADEGFLGLKEVSVKVTGEGGGSAPSAVEYLDLRGVDGDTRQFLETLSFLGRKEGYIFPTAFVAGLGSTSGQIKYVAIDFGVMCYNTEFGDGPVTLAECLDILGIASVVAAIPRITEEEFYAL